MKPNHNHRGGSGKPRRSGPGGPRGSHGGGGYAGGGRSSGRPPRFGPGPNKSGPRENRFGGGRFGNDRGSADRQRGRRAQTNIRIIFEDSDILVVEKPIGMITATPQPTGRTTLFDLVKDHVRQKHGRTARTWIVHRLDMEATGLLVFAKTETAFHVLKTELRARKMHRLYTAVVERPFTGGAESAGSIRRYLRERMDGSVESYAEQDLSRPPDPRNPHDPKPATTHFRVESQNETHALLRIRLETGRKHQIRVHLADEGHPIVGDLKYGTGANPMRRLALHATELGFTHPSTGQGVRFRSQTPDEFFRLVGADPAAVPQEELPEPVPAVRPHHDPRDGDLPDRARAEEPQETDSPPSEKGWDHVAEWYGEYQNSAQSDHFEDVILPGTIGLLRPRRDERFLDIACGEGTLCRRISQLGARSLGVDASPELIDLARRRGGGRFEVADARDLSTLEPTLNGDKAHAISCVMALMNIDPVTDVFKEVNRMLEPGGRFVGVILHPSFRSPGQTSWAWEGGRSHKGTQFRRVDGYLSPRAETIVMNPGEVSSGAAPVTTMTYHRPLQVYVQALAAAGLQIDAIEEWHSARRSSPGPRAAEENRARREIPLFMAIRAVKPRSE